MGWQAEEDQLTTPDSIELTKRYVASFKEYFDDIPADRLRAMSVNPLLVTRGFEDIFALLGESDGKKLMEMAKDLLTTSILNVSRLMLENESQANDTRGDDSAVDDDGIDSMDLSPLARL